MNYVSVVNGTRNRGFKEGDDVGRLSPAYRPCELGEALACVYDFDAYAVAYVVPGVERHCRLTKGGLDAFPGEVECSVFFADVDHNLPGQSGKVAWTVELLRQVQEQHASLDMLRTAGLYHTKGGYRLVQPLTRALPPREFELHLHAWLATLKRAGIHVDEHAKDWTRHFRLPHVRRDGAPFRAAQTLFRSMRPIDPDMLDVRAVRATSVEAQLQSQPGSVRHNERQTEPVAWSEGVPSEWREHIERIATAVRAVGDAWHPLFLAISGALARSRVPLSQVPVLVRAISAATGADARSEEREQQARYTIERLRRGEPVTGFPTLVHRWPAVAEEVSAATRTPLREALHEQAIAERVTPALDLDQAQQELEQLLFMPTYGIVLVAAECGFGKSAIACRAAVQRALKQYASATAQGLRAPLGSKTSISVDTNALSTQLANDIRAMCVTPKRYFGPLSVRSPDGSPVCKLHKIALPIVEGGQSMQYELCEGRGLKKCRFHEECTARLGYEGDSHSRITIGTHQRIDTLDSEAGSTGLLVVDEPSTLLESDKIDEEELVGALGMLSHFESRYVAAMEPALCAAQEWLQSADLDQPRSLHDVMRELSKDARVEGALSRAKRIAGLDGDVVDCVRDHCFPEGRRGTAPPMTQVASHRLRETENEDFARRLGAASRVLELLYQRLRTTSHVSLRVVAVRDKRKLSITGLNQRLLDAFGRDGSVVVLDANAELFLPVLQKVFGYRPQIYRFAAADGAPIQRTLTEFRGATRSGWFVRGELAIAPRLVSAVRQLFAWVAEDPSASVVGIITMRAVELALRAALHPDDPSIEKQWREAGWKLATLAEAREKLGPIVRGFQGEVRLGHYGAVRGLNYMADVDCLVTLGDPWPNLGFVKDEVMFLEQPEVFEERALAWCRAELEQAQGRIRAVHRKRPGRALHVGAVLPSGFGWSQGGVEIRALPNGRPRVQVAMDAAELLRIVAAQGGVRSVARSLSVSPNMVRKYLNGESVVGAERAQILRALAAPYDLGAPLPGHTAGPGER
jgi:hypothetical protein